MLKGEENIIKVDTKALKDNVKGATLALNSNKQAFKDDVEVWKINGEALKGDREALKYNGEAFRRKEQALKRDGKALNCNEEVLN